MKVKTSELTGAALDWAVSKCAGEAIRMEEGRVRFALSQFTDDCDLYSPSTDWAQGGPIIEQEKIDTEGRWNVRGCGVRTSFKEWCATHPKNHGGLIRYTGSGPTQLIAAMRCYVASKLGDEVDVPEELK